MTNTPSSPAYTRGPWVFDPDHLCIFDAAVKLGVAKVDDWNNRKEAIANGCLIAAAPELLEAANAAADILGSIVTDNKSDHGEEVALNSLAAAIAKARGE